MFRYLGRDGHRIMVPTQYLVAMVYSFVYAEVNPEVTVTNKGMAGLFKVSLSNLHKFVSGKKYHGGSHGESKKASSLKETDDHGEVMVKVIKKKTAKPTPSASGTSKSVSGFICRFVANNEINHIIAYVVCLQYIFRDPCKSEVKLINHEDINMRPWNLIPGTTSLLIVVMN